MALRDVAVIRLPTGTTQIAGARLLPLASRASTAYFAGRGVTIFGAGFDERGRDPAWMRKSPDHAWRQAKGCQIKGNLCFRLTSSGQDKTTTEYGDSGGPWVGWLHGGWRLLALHSGEVDEEDLPWLVTGAAVADPVIGDWLRRQIAAHANRKPPAPPPPPPAPAPQTPAPQPQPPAPAPSPQPSAPQPQPPKRKVVVVDNRVTNGTGMREDTTPVRLLTQPWVRCGSRGCNINGTERSSGGTYDAAICQRFGERTTNGHDTDPSDDANPLRFESTRYYGVRLANGTFGYVSETWIRADFRGGLGLPGC